MGNVIDILLLGEFLKTGQTLGIGNRQTGLLVTVLMVLSLAIGLLTA
jgi:hypothetical protein